MVFPAVGVRSFVVASQRTNSRLRVPVPDCLTGTVGRSQVNLDEYWPPDRLVQITSVPPICGTAPALASVRWRYVHIAPILFDSDWFRRQTHVLLSVGFAISGGSARPIAASDSRTPAASSTIPACRFMLSPHKLK